jgi:hypothetical protein
MSNNMVTHCTILYGGFFFLVKLKTLKLGVCFWKAFNHALKKTSSGAKKNLIHQPNLSNKQGQFGTFPFPFYVNKGRTSCFLVSKRKQKIRPHEHFDQILYKVIVRYIESFWEIRKNQLLLMFIIVPSFVEPDSKSFRLRG